jgi:hypothetical protein
MPSNKIAESALNIVAQHEEGDEIKRLRDENQKLKAALDAVEKEMTEKSEYYRNLVWYANRGPGEQEKYCPQFWDKMKKLLGGGKSKRYKKFLKECNALSGESGDWNHGFNSGCLAMSRLALGLAETEDEEFEDGDEDSETGENIVHIFSAEDRRREALEEFPFLDI